MIQFKIRRVGFIHISEPCAKYLAVKVQYEGTEIDLGLLNLADRKELKQTLLDTIEDLEIPTEER